MHAGSQPTTTQRPALEQIRPDAHEPHVPPAPSGPHSRAVQLRALVVTHTPDSQRNPLEHTPHVSVATLRDGPHSIPEQSGVGPLIGTHAA